MQSNDLRTPSSSSTVHETEHERRVRQEIRRAPSAHEEHKPNAKPKKRRAGTVRQLLTGTILLREDLSRYYRYLWGIAVMFFVSIAVMFLALQFDLNCSSLEREVRILRAKATSLSSERYRKTTHTAIQQQIIARGLDLRDPSTPARQLDD